MPDKKVTRKRNEKAEQQSAPVNLGLVVFKHLLAAGLLFLILQQLILYLPHLPITNCMYASSGNIFLSLEIVTGLLLVYFLLGKYLKNTKWGAGLVGIFEGLGSDYLLKFPRSVITLAVCLALTGLVYYLGSYGNPPFNFRESPNSIEQIMVVPESGGNPISVQPDALVSVHNGANINISAVTDPSGGTCSWVSMDKGVLQTLGQCSASYSPPPGATSDILEVRALSACGTQQTIKHLNISILP